MKLGTLVAQLIERSGVDQKAVAAEWKVQWDKREPDDVRAFDTVETRLSELRRGKSDGIRFFFNNALRRELLLTILEPTDAERQEILALGEEELRRGGGGPLRLVVDLTSLQGDPELVIGAAADVFLVQPDLGTLAVVVTEPQYLRLTIAWTDRKTRIERVKTPADGAKLAREIAGDAIVASRWRYEPYERWLAMDMGRRELAMDPEDALQCLARDGRLDRLPEVAADLRTLGIEPVEPSADYSGTALRRVIRGLAAGEVPECPHPANRLGLALRLGVAAGASEDERIVIALRTAGLPAPTKLEAEELELRLDRAKRRPLPAAVLRVGPEWHVLNGEVPVEWRENPRVHGHRFTIRPTGLARLRSAVAGWTADDYAADPRLESLMAGLDPDGDQRELRFARAWLSERDALPIVGTTAPADSLEAVRGLLAEAAPEAEVVLVAAEGTRRTTHETGKGPPAFLVVGSAPYSGDGDVLEQSAGRWWRQWWSRTQPAASVRVEQRTHSGRRFDNEFDAFQKGGDRTWELPAHVGLGEPHANEDEAFLDRWEVLLKGSAASTIRRRWRSGDPQKFTVLKAEPLRTPDWSYLDATVALVWTGLRAAAATGHALRLPGGDLLFRVGGGVAARLEVRRWPTASAPRAGLHLPFESGGSGGRLVERDLYAVVPVWTAGGHNAGPRLPVALTVAGRGIAADVRFLSDPLGAALPSVLAAPGAQPLGPVTALAGAIEDERRRNDD